MAKSKKINIRTLAKVHTVVMAFIGLIAGVLYAGIGAIIDVLVSSRWITSQETPGVGYGTALAFLAIIAMPILLAIFGFIVGGMVAGLYNLISGWVGGIELDLEQKSR